MELRNFTVNDAEELRRLRYGELSQEDVRRMIGEWERFEYLGKYFEMFAVVSDGKIVGELSIYEHSASVVSIGLEIFADFQGQGFGKQAIAEALPICKRRGFKIVCDQVRTDNEPCIALHKGMGFESDMYCYKNQKGHDVYLFLKALE